MPRQPLSKNRNSTLICHTYDTESNQNESDVVIELYDMDYADSNQRQLFLGPQFHGETTPLDPTIDLCARNCHKELFVLISTDSESDDQRITFNGMVLKRIYFFGLL